MNTDFDGPFRMLVGLLADCDAPFFPIRNWAGHRGGNTYAARRQFKTNGVPWASEKATEADRKAAQRQLHSLAAAKLVTVHRVRGQKPPSVQLTALGYAQARRACGMPDLAGGWALLTKAAGLSKHPPKLLADYWIHEARLADDLPAYPLAAEFGPVAAMALPALQRGWIACNSDAHGQAYYAVTDAGRKMIPYAPANAGPPAPDPAADPRPEAIGVYLGELKRAFARLEVGEPADPREIGYLPLPVAIDGLEYSAAWTAD